jgi:hypothetical protein
VRLGQWLDSAGARRHVPAKASPRIIGGGLRRAGWEAPAQRVARNTRAPGPRVQCHLKFPFPTVPIVKIVGSR